VFAKFLRWPDGAAMCAEITSRSFSEFSEGNDSKKFSDKNRGRLSSAKLEEL